MLKDLAANPGQSISLATEIAIIGGGTVGLLMAARLADAGHRVLVIESGGLTQDHDTHPLNEIEQTGDTYLGATLGRARCLGGTSTRWGGAMLPFQAWDWQVPHSCGWNTTSGFAFSELAQFVPELERLFSLPTSDYDQPALVKSPSSPAAFIPRMAKWPAFGLRNVANIFATPITAKGHDIWLNATTTAHHMGPSGKLESVVAQSANGSTLHVSAQHWVFTCGAIENTRQLQLLDRSVDGQIFDQDKILGRFFHDHISAPVATVDPANLTHFNQLFSFGFEGSAMRNLRFEPSEGLRKANHLPAGFAHIGFSTEERTGFDTLRDILRAVQSKTAPGWKDFAGIFKQAPWLMKAAWWRTVHKRLLFPPGARFTLHLVAEQEPVASNAITLSDTQRDIFGQPAAKLAWQISKADEQNLLGLSTQFAAFWAQSSLSTEGQLLPIDTATSLAAMRAEGGVYHPGGTTRISNDRRTGIANSYGQSHGIPNLWPISTALLPTGGGANPTMTLMLMGMRAADRLSSLI